MGQTIIDRLLSGLRHRRGEQFDRRHGIEASKAVKRDALTGMDEELREHAGDYVPGNPGVLKRIVRKSGVDPAAFTFVDLGCGKGRMLVAASVYPFRAILGIEADADLFAAAERNMVSAQASGRITVVHQDARTADLPAGNLFIYMYSPFRGPIFKQVAERLAALADEPRRAVVIAYSADWEAEVLERTARFVRVPMRRRQFWAPSTVSFFYNSDADRMRRGTDQGVFRPST